MATISQFYYKVLNTSNSRYDTNPANLDIYSNLVTLLYGATSFSKVGILAPPGTRVVMGTDTNLKTIMIGRSGIYELDEGININTLYFDKVRKYQKDEDLSASVQEAGRIEMLKADDKRTNSLVDLSKDYPRVPTNESDANYTEYWNRYNDILSTYIEEYLKAFGEFNMGINGIYTLPDPNNPDAEVNYKPLLNIIVDFMYE